MAKDSIRGIFFDIDEFDREELSYLTEQELYDITLDSKFCSIYTLDEISERTNDDMLNFDSNWLFFIDLNNVSR